MGNLFGGGGGGGQESGYLPNQPFNIPGEASLLPSAIWRGQAALPWTTSPQRTIDYGHGEYNPQTMGMQLPQFNPQQQQPQANPWLQQKQMPMGGFAYQQPFNNVGWNPQQAAGPQQQQQAPQQPQGQPQQQAPQQQQAKAKPTPPKEGTA